MELLVLILVLMVLLYVWDLKTRDGRIWENEVKPALLSYGKWIQSMVALILGWFPKRKPKSKVHTWAEAKPTEPSSESDLRIKALEKKVKELTTKTDNLVIHVEWAGPMVTAHMVKLEKLEKVFEEFDKIDRSYHHHKGLWMKLLESKSWDDWQRKIANKEE